MKLPKPERVSRDALNRCRDELREPILKTFLRKLYSKFLKKRYCMANLGEGFRWGYKWHVKRRCLSVGHFAFIGSNAWIIYPTVIGDLTLVAPHFKIAGNDHGIYECGKPIRISKPDVPYREKVTIIGSEVWVGQNVTIIHGVNVGRGAVIAAGSVVTMDVPPYTVVGGVPARQIKKRFTAEDVIAHEQIVYVNE